MKKKMPKSIRKFIRKEKSRLRREVLDGTKRKELVSELYSRFLAKTEIRKVLVPKTENGKIKKEKKSKEEAKRDRKTDDKVVKIEKTESKIRE